MKEKDDTKHSQTIYERKIPTKNIQIALEIT